MGHADLLSYGLGNFLPTDNRPPNTAIRTKGHEMRTHAIKANVLNVFDMGLIGLLLGLSYAGAYERVITLM